MNGHAPENGSFLPTENRVNGHAPEKGTRERVCSGIWKVLLQFVVFSSCLRPIFRANGHEKRGFEWSTFCLILKCFYSKVGGYAPEYVTLSFATLLLSLNRISCLSHSHNPRTYPLYSTSYSLDGN